MDSCFQKRTPDKLVHVEGQKGGGVADVRPLSHSVTSEGEHDCTDWLHPTTPGVEINHIVFAGKNVSSNGIFKMLNFPTSPCNFDGQPGHEGGLDDEETSGMVRRVTCSSVLSALD